MQVQIQTGRGDEDVNAEFSVLGGANSSRWTNCIYAPVKGIKRKVNHTRGNFECRWDSWLEKCLKIIEKCSDCWTAIRVKSVKHRNSKYPGQISLRREFHHAGMWFREIWSRYFEFRRLKLFTKDTIWQIKHMLMLLDQFTKQGYYCYQKLPWAWYSLRSITLTRAECAMSEAPPIHDQMWSDTQSKT